MRKITILQLARALATDDPQLFAFFDRALCHVLGLTASLPPSTTEALLARGEALQIDCHSWVITAEEAL